MGCGCKRQAATKYLWYNGEADEPKVYESKVEARARVIRSGGTFIPYNPNEAIGSQIAIAEAERVSAG